MSEIKGTLLGIILTITVFGIVLVTLGGVFQNVSDTLGERMTNASEQEYTSQVVVLPDAGE